MTTTMTAPTSRAPLTRWAQMLRKAADLLDKAEPPGIAYDAATKAVALVADEMYAMNDAMARAAWEQVTGKQVAS